METEIEIGSGKGLGRGRMEERERDDSVIVLSDPHHTTNSLTTLFL